MAAAEPEENLFDPKEILSELIRDKVLDKDFHKEIAALPTNVQRFDKLHDLLQPYLDKACIVYDGKYDDAAIILLEKGEKMQKEEKLLDALTFYTKSLGYAKSLKQSAIAYFKRAEILYRWGMGPECVMDIERAKALNHPENLENEKKKAEALPELLIEQHAKKPSFAVGTQNKKISSANYQIKMKNSRDYGRHLVAAKHIQIGDVIMIDEPFAFVMNRNDYYHCHYCYKLCYNPIPCNDCSARFYCGEICMFKDALFHRFECFIMRTKFGTSLDLLAFKMTYLLRLNLGDMKKFQTRETVYYADEPSFSREDSMYLSTRYNEIYNLEHHLKQYPSHLLINNVLFTSVRIYYVLKKYTNFFKLYDDEGPEGINNFKRLIMKHRAVLRTNYRRMTETVKVEGENFKRTHRGSGIYAAISLFNHSCSPNVAEVSFGNTRVVYAIRSMLPGEQIFTNYGVTYDTHPLDKRQEFLLNNYNFRCKCTACVGNWPVLDDEVLKKRKYQSCYKVLNSGDVQFIRNSIFDRVDYLAAVEQEIPSEAFSVASRVVEFCIRAKGNIRTTPTVVNGPLR